MMKGGLIEFFCDKCEMHFWLDLKDVDKEDHFKITDGYELRVHCPCCQLTNTIDNTNLTVVDY